MHGSHEKDRRRRRRTVSAVALTALLVAAGTLATRHLLSSGDPGPDGRAARAEAAELHPFLPGVPGLEGARPSGSVERYGDFRWDLEPHPGWKLRLRVYDDTKGVHDRPLAAPEPFAATEWSPAPEVAARWPDRILWTVGLVAPDGHEYVPYAVRARRER